MGKLLTGLNYYCLILYDVFKQEGRSNQTIFPFWIQLQFDSVLFALCAWHFYFSKTIEENITMSEAKEALHCIRQAQQLIRVRYCTSSNVLTLYSIGLLLHAATIIMLLFKKELKSSGTKVYGSVFKINMIFIFALCN